jgi:hypothetical protein
MAKKGCINAHALKFNGNPDTLSDNSGKKIPLAREEYRLVTGLRAEPKKEL